MTLHKLHKVQERIFDFTFLIIYILYFVIALGLSAAAPKYLSFLDYYVKIYVSLFLIWRFNPFRNVKFTSFDKKIVFNAGIFVLFATTSINEILINYVKNQFNL
jgi:cytochrome c biogenesis protein CcdA